MADTITTNVIFNGKRRLVLEVINQSDGTGQSAATLVDASAYPNPYDTSKTVNYFGVEWITWSIQGMTHVDLFFNATANVPLIAMQGNSFIEFPNLLVDPANTGYNGDILVTTNNALTTSSYTIQLSLIKILNN